MFNLLKCTTRGAYKWQFMIVDEEPNNYMNCDWSLMTMLVPYSH